MTAQRPGQPPRPGHLWTGQREGTHLCWTPGICAWPGRCPVPGIGTGSSASRCPGCGSGEREEAVWVSRSPGQHIQVHPPVGACRPLGPHLWGQRSWTKGKPLEHGGGCKCPSVAQSGIWWQAGPGGIQVQSSTLRRPPRLV